MACMDLNLLNKDIAFVGYCDPPFYAWIQGAVSTIQIPADELAVRTVGMVIDGFEKVEQAHNRFEAKLVKRDL